MNWSQLFLWSLKSLLRDSLSVRLSRSSWAICLWVVGILNVVICLKMLHQVVDDRVHKLSSLVTNQSVHTAKAASNRSTKNLLLTWHSYLEQLLRQSTWRNDQWPQLLYIFVCRLMFPEGDQSYQSRLKLHTFPRHWYTVEWWSFLADFGIYDKTFLTSSDMLVNVVLHSPPVITVRDFGERFISAKMATRNWVVMTGLQDIWQSAFSENLLFPMVKNPSFCSIWLSGLSELGLGIYTFLWR